MYLKILRFRGDRAICATDIGKDLDVRRSLLPMTASVGDAFKLGLNATYDGLTYEPITEDEHRRHKKIVEARRKGARFVV